MGNYLAVFLAPRVLGLMAAVVLVSAVLTWLLRSRLRRPGRAVGEQNSVPRRARPLVFFGFLVSLGSIIVVTLLRDPWVGATCWDCLDGWGLDRVLTGRVGTEVLLNVVLFVPMAFFAALLWRAPWRTVGSAFLLSLAIEIVQPVFGPGANDLMDLIANTAGAAIGAGAAAFWLLVTDTARDRRLDLPRLARVMISLAAGAAVLIAAPAWAASAQQATAVERLEDQFAATTLVDFEANWDDGWNAALNELQAEWGGPATTTMVVRAAHEAARVRFTWNIYFAVRCVVAEWTPDGFAAIPRSGAVCGAPLAEVP